MLFFFQVVTPLLLLSCIGVEVSSSTRKKEVDLQSLMKGGAPNDNDLHLCAPIHVLVYPSEYVHLLQSIFFTTLKDHKFQPNQPNSPTYR